jgi:hypothetical protein
LRPFRLPSRSRSTRDQTKPLSAFSKSPFPPSLRAVGQRNNTRGANRVSTNYHERETEREREREIGSETVRGLNRTKDAKFSERASRVECSRRKSDAVEGTRIQPEGWLTSRTTSRRGERAKREVAKRGQSDASFHRVIRLSTVIVNRLSFLECTPPRTFTFSSPLRVTSVLLPTLPPSTAGAARTRFPRLRDRGWREIANAVREPGEPDQLQYRDTQT